MPATRVIFIVGPPLMGLFGLGLIRIGHASATAIGFLLAFLLKELEAKESSDL